MTLAVSQRVPSKYDPNRITDIARSVERALNPALQKISDWIDVKADYGAKGDGSTDDTNAFSAAISDVAAGGAVVFPCGKYVGVVSVRKSNVTLIFEGCTITQPDSTDYPAVLEFGDLASGNSATAYSQINVVGQVLLDGNKSGITTPSDDLTGWGFACTKISNSDFGNGIRVTNCYNGGVGILIDSNYNKGAFYVESCGNATYTGPGFDINSSKYCVFDFVSKSCYTGARLLDNCYGNNIRGSVYNSTADGLVYNNQTTNSSYANNIDVTVYTAGQHGINLQYNSMRTNIRASVYDATEIGAVIGFSASYPCSNLNIDLVTSNSGAQGLLLKVGGEDNIIRHQSYLDGRTGSQGTSYAVDVYGDRNKLLVDLIDSSTWQVRGVNFRSGATDNELLSYSYTNTADPLSDSGTRTKINHGQGRGVDIASASTITLPALGTIFHITGTTNIDTMAGSGGTDQFITLIFDDILTVTKGSNLKLGAGGDFVSTADSTLSGVWDGTNFYETGRSVT